jgi:hypothetical protein
MLKYHLNIFRLLFISIPFTNVERSLEYIQTIISLPSSYLYEFVNKSYSAIKWSPQQKS